MSHHRVRTRALVGIAAGVVGLVAIGPASAAHPARRTATHSKLVQHTAAHHRTAITRHAVPASGPVIATSRGPVRGFHKQGISEFLGIPYAAPPVGRLRWRPPQQHAQWTKVLKATHYGPRCPQITTLGVFADASVTENCLYLNVFTPKVSTSKHGLPVLVWIHGGGNVDGESNDYNGQRLATGQRHGGHNMVVVTINYRLGLLGFLANSALDSEGHKFGNYGIMDQQAALRWVQQNIAKFGGDPHRVTLGGQSAGATDTGANVISPQSAGLFDRAIFESKFLPTLPSLSTAVSKGNAFAGAAGCGGSGPAQAACLRHLTVPQILQLQGSASANGPYVNGPMVDGTTIPIAPNQAWTSGAYNHMPMMGGTVKDEGDFSIGITEYFENPQAPITAQQFTNTVDSTFVPPTYPAGTADKVLAEYPLSNYPTPQLALDAATTDPGVCQDIHVAGQLSQRVPVYDYKFNDQSAPYYFPKMPGFVPLAAHTIDIQFLFNQWHGGQLGVGHPLVGDQRTLSDELVTAWTNFGATGNPNGTGSTPWPRYDPAPNAQSVLSENVPALSTLSPQQVSNLHHCDFWNPILGY